MKLLLFLLLTRHAQALITPWKPDLGTCGADPGAPICEDDETCCLDSPGCTGVCSECCLNQVDTCVPPRAGFQTSTCCPKWTVSCSVGSVGCCDPARPWQQKKMADTETYHVAGHRQPNRLRALSQEGMKKALPDLEVADVVEEDGSLAARADGGKAYALFSRPLLPGLVAYSIDASSGKVTHHTGVHGPFADYIKLYYGEGTRLFPWDPKTARFYFADVDLSGGGVGNASSPVILYTIDPATGASTAAPLSGCSGYPVGLAWDAPKGKLVLATQTKATVTFHAVDVAAASAEALGAVSRGASEGASAAYYSAYVSHADSGVAYRVGHKVVTKGGELGVGQVAFSSASEAEAAPAASWRDLEWGTHELPATVHSSGDELIGLAPKKLALQVAYDIVAFDKKPAGTGDAARADGGLRVLANLNNSHPPIVPLLHEPLGYVGASVVGTRFGAMTVAKHPSAILPGVGDKWQLVTLDLAAAAGAGASSVAREMPLAPQPSFEGAETVSLSGFGLAA